jgi:hypothetical protein
LCGGAALNEGRALFPSDEQFGQWVEANVLGQLAQGRVEPKEQQAAMWAAANRDQFDEARAACLAANAARAAIWAAYPWQQFHATFTKSDMGTAGGCI